MSHVHHTVQGKASMFGTLPSCQMNAAADFWRVALSKQSLSALARRMVMRVITGLAQILRQTSVQACNAPRLANRRLLSNLKLCGEPVHATIEA